MSSRVLLAAGLLAAFGSGCATVMRGSRNELILHSAPADLKVFDQGQQVALTHVKTESDGKSRFKGMVSPKSRELRLQSGGQEASVPLRSSMGAGWFVADLLLTGVIGLIVDGVSGRWNDFSDVDVSTWLASGKPVATGGAVTEEAPLRNEAAPEKKRKKALSNAPAPEPPPISERTAVPAVATVPVRGQAVVTSGKLAVLDFKSYATDFKPEDVRYFTDLVRGATLRAAPALEVMTRENLLVLLQATGKDIAKCEGECEVDTGRRIGADAVVSGDVLKVGTRFKMSLKLHETHNGRLLSTSIASGKTVDELDESLHKAAEELMRPTR